MTDRLDDFSASERRPRSADTLHREGSLTGLLPRNNAAAGPNRSPGSAGCCEHPTVTPRDAPETSPFRRLGRSSRRARPPKGDGLAGHARGNRDPRHALTPGSSASAPVLLQLGRRAAAVVRHRFGPTGSRRGGQSNGSGVRARAAVERPRSRSSSDNARSSRSPSSPQFGSRLPASVRRLTRITTYP